MTWSAREGFAKRRGANLRYVLRKRIAWMQRYLGPDTYAVELGCGAGFSEMFLRAGTLELTDTEPRPGVTRVANALAMPYADGSVDVLIANNVVHHLAYPAASSVKPRASCAAAVTSSSSNAMHR